MHLPLYLQVKSECANKSNENQAHFVPLDHNPDLLLWVEFVVAEVGQGHLDQKDENARPEMRWEFIRIYLS